MGKVMALWLAHACYVRQPTESGSLLVSDSSSNSSSVSTGSCGSEYASSVRSEDTWFGSLDFFYDLDVEELDFGIGEGV
eukprot:Nk52_evm1s1428 gene=Nk52_evmTU1s1428